MNFNIEHNLEDLDLDISMEEVKRRTLKRAADELAEMVAVAVRSEDDITSPGLNSKYGRGPGPSMATKSAWVVERKGNSYTVSPHPLVEQRAVVLNYGYPGKIRPKNADFLKFTVKGVPEPIYAKEVDGPDETGYWQAAMTNFEKSGRLEEIALEELEREAQE
jgi:hypothetical protein